MKRFACGFTTAVLLANGVSAATIFIEDFEDAVVSYTLSTPEFTDGSSDFLLRTDGSGISGGYNVSGQGGSFYFAGQDLDGEGASLPIIQTFSGINISGKSNLGFSILLAEDDDGSSQDWDAPDSVRIEYQIDGTGFNDLLAIANDGSTFNSAPLIDTDFDGIGDGTEITDIFAEFTKDIAFTGNELDLRITWQLDSGDEDLAIDNVTITGDDGGPVNPPPPPPPPTSFALINEFQPNPNGSDPSTTEVEVLGTPNESFTDLWLLSIESDNTGTLGSVDFAQAFSGTFDANGLAVLSLPDLENPSFTLLLADDFTGSTNTELGTDLNNLDLSTLGNILDAVGISDSFGDDNLVYGEALGFVDIDYTGDEPQLVFRDGKNPSTFWAINDPAGTEAFDQVGNTATFDLFNMDPTSSTFGAVNPSLIPSPTAFAFGIGGLLLTSVRRRRG